MSIRQFIRGTIPWSQLEAVALEVARRYDQEAVRLTFFEAENWLSTPCIVNDQWFVKVISPQNALVHALLTGARNLGAFSSGSEGFFVRFESPIEMAEHELEATRRMQEIGLHAPEPIETFEVDGLGVVVLAYLDDFEILDDLDPDAIREFAPDLFRSLATMHEHELAHGDLRGENVLIRDDDIFFIDATAVSPAGMDEARAYDLASALAALEPHIGANATVQAAAAEYSDEVLLAAVDFLDFVNIRPDHDFDAAAVKGEVSKVVST